MGYLSATSRNLGEPLSVLVQSRSAAGKSTVVLLVNTQGTTHFVAVQPE